MNTKGFVMVLSGVLCAALVTTCIILGVNVARERERHETDVIAWHLTSDLAVGTTTRKELNMATSDQESEAVLWKMAENHGTRFILTNNEDGTYLVRFGKSRFSMKLQKDKQSWTATLREL